MSDTPTGPDDVAAPAADAVLFHSAPGWVFLTTLLVAVPIMAAGGVLIELLDGAGLGWRDWAAAAADALPLALLIAALAAAQVWQRRTWVRISSGGVELAARGGDPVLLDWAEIVSARVRRRWLWTVLDVVPVDPYNVRSVEPQRDPPRMRDTGYGAAFTVEVGGLRPGPAALRAALARHTSTNYR